MYHVNAEGKVYRCRAKIRKCPYKIHAGTREEALRLSAGMKEYGRSTYYDEWRLTLMERHGELYYDTRREWKSDGTIEGELNTLYKVLKAYDEHSWRAITKKPPTKIGEWERDIASEMWRAYKIGFVDVSTYVPEYKGTLIEERTLRRFEEKYPYRKCFAPQYDATYSDWEPIEYLKKPRTIGRMQIIEKWTRTRRTQDYINERKEKLKRAIHFMESFLIAEKMLNRTKFEGNRDEIVKSIRVLSDKELIGVFEDYNITEREFEEAMDRANHFWETSDTSNEIAISIHHEMALRRPGNRKKLAQRRKENPVDNLLILLESHAELERRNIHHVDIIDTRWDY